MHDAELMACVVNMDPVIWMDSKWKALLLFISYSELGVI